MNWTEFWVAILAVALTYDLWQQRRLKKEIRDGLALKTDKKFLGGPRPRARRVDTVFHDRDDQGREHWLCVNCGASVPQMGHTVAACEERQTEVAEANTEAERDNTEQIAEAIKETI